MGKKTFSKARKVSQLMEAAKLSRQKGAWAGRVASYPSFWRDSVRRPVSGCGKAFLYTYLPRADVNLQDDKQARLQRPCLEDHEVGADQAWSTSH